MQIQTHVETQTSPYTQNQWYCSVALTLDEEEDSAKGFPFPDSSALHQQNKKTLVITEH
jgi:hypothetical protein